MIEFLENIDYWQWLIFGVLLIIIELFAWSTLFLWIGISAIIVGIVSAIFPDLYWQVQILSFAMLSIVSMLLVKKYIPTKTTDNKLNARAQSHIGKTYVVASNDEHGLKLKVDDSLWLAEGYDAKVGEKVQVIDVESNTLIINKIQ